MASAPGKPTVVQRGQLEAERNGGEEAFRRLVEPHRGALHAHCYRMLGSLHDADDTVQETLLRAWRALPRFGGKQLIRPWLYRIATNACLDAIGRRPKRVLPMDYVASGGEARGGDHPLAASLWIEPYPDGEFALQDGRASPEARYEQREAVELAFIAALQLLPPRQRAVLILRDVLGFSAREVAEALETSVASVNSALQRARSTIDDSVPSRSQQATARSLGDERLDGIVRRFIDACEAGEIDTILALLTDDATFAMPPYPRWERGRAALADSWLMPGEPPTRLLYLPARANGQLAVGAYHLDPAAGRYFPIALDVLTLRGVLISAVVAFRIPEVFPRFGLPRAVAARGQPAMPGPSDSEAAGRI